MRGSNHSRRDRRLSPWAAGLLAIGLAACSSPPPASTAPTPAPTPVITPDPHLSEPATADQIFRALGAAKLPIVANNANAGGDNPHIVKLINADLGGWPLRIIEYRTTAFIKNDIVWKPGQAPGVDEPPYAFIGLNVLVQYGPISARKPEVPDSNRQAAAATIAAVLDPLLWPLRQRSVVAVPVRTAEPVATPAPSAKASAKPVKSPKPAKSPKPSKKP